MDGLLKELADSLEDNVLTRSERKEVKQILKLYSPSDHELGVIRAKAFEMAQVKFKETGSDSVWQWIEEVNKCLLPIKEKKSSARAYFTPKHNLRDILIGQIDQVRECLDICVFTISDNEISKAILSAHRRGVAIRLISDNDKQFDKGSDIEFLRERGVHVKVDFSTHHMHHKFAIFDREKLLNGSFNWTRSATDYNWENYLITEDEQLVKAYRKEFTRFWNEL